MDFITILRNELPRFKNVLELSSQKGENLQALHEYYEVVASEDEKIKTRYLKDEFIDIRVILLNPLTIDTHKKFDCIFSKNLFDTYSLVEINESLENQKKVLNPDGLIFHIFNIDKIDKNEILTLVNINYELLECDNIDTNNFYMLAKIC